MEKKIKHRILGMLVIVGLVIILLPLFQGGNELPVNAQVVKAPPFPDQSVQVSTVAPMSVSQQPDDTISVANANIVQQIEAPAIANTNDNKNVLPSASNNDVKNINAAESVKAPDPFNPTALAPAVKTAENTSVPALKKATHAPVRTVLAKPAAKIKVVKNTKTTTVTKPVFTYKSLQPAHITKNDAVLAKNGLIELKKAAWVIQMGTFKNKAHALRLVNQLRASGYRAFIQQISFPGDENTRVFVGPENKPTAARALVQRLENDVHIRGIVISYQPLNL